MTTPSVVRAIHLRLRVPEALADEAPGLRATAEHELVHRVLDALEAEIHARLGPRAIVCMKRLAVRWRLSRADLDDRARLRELGCELADAMLSGLPAGGWPSVAGDATGADAPPRPHAEATMVAFIDEAHRFAVALADRAEGRPEAFHHPAASLDALWRAIVAGGDELVARVLALVEAYGVAREVLGSAPPVIARRVASARHREPSSTMKSEVSRVASAAVVAARPAGIIETGHDVTALSTKWTATQERSVPSSPHIEKLAGVVSARAATALRPFTPVSPGQLVDTELDVFPTRLGGAFYLLSRVAELDLAEHLWCAGLPEGIVIAHAVACLVPRELHRDAALGVIAGAGDAALPRWPDVASWAQDEVVAKTQHALGAWLARRGEPCDADTLASRLSDAGVGLGEPYLSRMLATALAVDVSVRLGRTWSAEHARELALRDGTIACSADEIVVELPLASVDVDVRRAGLDFDPGWIPWLARTVRVTFVSHDRDIR